MTLLSNTLPGHGLGPNTVSLAIETSGRVGSVALAIGDTITEKADLSGFRRHSSELMVIINDLLKRRQLVPDNIDYIYFPKGPGSFTGIRIAVTFAKMAAFALKAKVIAVNTLDALAENVTQNIQNTTPIQRLATILDAKRGLFYAAVFDYLPTGPQRISDDLLITPANFLQQFCSQNTPIHLLGEGLLYYQKQFEHSNTIILDEVLWPAHAESVWRVGQKLAQAGKFDDPDTLVPLYIRRPEAEELWEKRKQSTP